MQAVRGAPAISSLPSVGLNIRITAGVGILVFAGVITDTVMKSGDDLRQDQVILGMLELFNTIWQREGVVHVLAGSGATVPGVTQLFVRWFRAKI